MTNLPRNDYPRPQFVRGSWVSLNGAWEFAFDDSRAGRKEKWHLGGTALSGQIQVPFTFESKLSGIGEPGFHDTVWYRRAFDVPEDWSGKRVLLHFGAVDYLASVWVNGELVATHEGGHTPFSADITEALQSEGDNVLVVRAEDFSLNLSLPRGKQFWQPKSRGIFYTRTTGIWQSVWMEAVEETHLAKVRMTPNIDKGELEIHACVNGLSKDDSLALKVEVSFKGTPVTEDVYGLKAQEEVRTVLLQHYNGFRRCHLWSPETPNLYDVKFTLTKNGQIVDEVTSYFGMRKISVENGRLMLNNRFYYMRLVLDQGYFPDGNLTPPSDDAIKKDVELMKEMGFNGARKHQKLEDPRYHYWCDKLGLLVWSEAANAYQYSFEYVRRFTKEWQESIDRDYNHPCIVAWVPLNESWGVWDIKENEYQQQHALAMYHLTRSLDKSRLVVSNDGWEHMRTDLLTIHDYEASQEVLEERYRTAESSIHSLKPHTKLSFAAGMQYEGQPILVSEFGGISFKKSEWEGWGYSGAENDEDFLAKLKAVVDPMLTSPVIQGFCYTQLTDVEQEINGLVTYDRTPKVPLEQIRSIVAGKIAPKSI
ncbi:glycoside hydrolase family 2 protein [Paenibacillus allorhizosphaerae]|uniref:Beta-galactosidase n=1 Tax=Paenibacillus allorhizosphaerae TaxID=2849866 RepID=A0ABM8V9X3_9BACL|nr:sugar-binding domain-containing protein [Paenibacillus allorhizosphaerae]CAG7614554.1 Beta-galactosidase [Paenibacillus allorhizosphaerae]